MLKFKLKEFKETIISESGCEDFEPNILHNDDTCIYECTKQNACKNFCAKCYKSVLIEENE